MQNGGNFVFALIAVITLINSNPTLSEISEKDVNEAEMDTMELILLQGYPAEKHVVNTEDGYQLTIYRIPHGKTIPESGQTPVLLMHGTFQSSSGWVDNLDDSLGFLLANEHYDVWLGNVRGNECTHHSLYTKEEAKFWDYTLEDIAEYDVSATIEYIREITKQKKIFYIGYSIGSTFGFALLSSKPEFNDKVAGFVAIAPIMSPLYTTGFVIEAITRKMEPVLTSLQMSRFNPKVVIQMIISLMIAYPSFADFMLMFSGGYSAYTYFPNKSRLPIFIHHTLESTSLKNLRHYHQLNKGRMARFDYGKKINIEKYGKIASPEYNTNNIVVPVALISGDSDVLSTPIDVVIIKRKLKSILAHEIIRDANHLSLAYSHPSRAIVFDKLLAILEYIRDVNSRTHKTFRNDTWDMS